MKRAPRTQRDELNELFSQLAAESLDYAEAEEPELLSMIEAYLDDAIQIQLRNDPHISVYYPQKRLLWKLRNHAPKKLAAKSHWKSKSQMFEDSLIIEWCLTSIKDVENVLGHGVMNERMYPDSEGVVNFRNKQGG